MSSHHNQLKQQLKTNEISLPALKLQYTYSCNSNESNCSDLFLSSVNSFSQQHEQLKFLESSKIFNTIKTNVDELSHMMINEDLIIYLLNKFKWNPQKLLQHYYEYLAQEYQLKNQQILNYQYNNITGFCQVCCQNNKQLIRNYFCQHYFCKNCWIAYSQTQLSDGQLFFSCMNKCSNSPVLLPLLEKFDTNLAEIGLKKLCINFTHDNKNISYCPKYQCKYFCSKPATMHINYVQCLCGQIYCFSCQQQPHYPASCADVIKWQKLTNKQEHNSNWIKDNTKKCPQCDKSVQKYIGCNYVKCICGCKFCFLCAVSSKQHRDQFCTKIENDNKNSKFNNPQYCKLKLLLNRVFEINSTKKNHLKIIDQCMGVVQEQKIKENLNSLKSHIIQAWLIWKWGLICSYLYDMGSIEVELENDYSNSIISIMQLLKKIMKNYKKMSAKQLHQTGEEVVIKKQYLKKVQKIWLDAWRNLT